MKRLYKTKENAVALGVCAGLGECFNIDPWIIRAIATIIGFSVVGIVIYFVVGFILPDKYDV